MKKRKKFKKLKRILLSIIVIVVAIPLYKLGTEVYRSVILSNASHSTLTQLEYNGEVAIEINNNKPSFTDEEIEQARQKSNGYEKYSDLDKYGRCGVAEACLCEATRPRYGEKRGDISRVYPSGWQVINFWSRCHLIGWQLCAENDNEKNLITGTSYMNVSGMLEYENMVAEYLNNNSDAHVLYRVDPIFSGKELVARGIEMQALSLEDNGQSVSFHVYVFNYQPGYLVNYLDGTVEDDPAHQTIITLNDKTAKYTGEAIEIDDAIVKGSTGEVKYIYYSDAATHSKINGLPRERGTYYVRAMVGGDNWYPSAVSETATLVIK